MVFAYTFTKEKNDSIFEMIKDFVHLSKYAGMREDLVQAGGGNSSVKIDGSTMLIKASGYQLAELTLTSGYSTIDYASITEAFNNCVDVDALSEEEGKKILASALKEGGRPSIETFLHAITSTYTIHTHPILVNVLMARKDAQVIVSELFPEAVFVPYATPGIELAKAYFKALKGWNLGSRQVIFLQNHGLVVSGKDEKEVVRINEEVIFKIEDYLGLRRLFEPYHIVSQIWDLFPEKVIWRVTDSNVLDVYKSKGLWKHQFCPDCIVFLGKKIWSPVNIDNEELFDFKSQYGDPIIIEWSGNLYIVAASVKKAMEVQSVLSFSAQVMSQVKDEDCNFLSNQEQNFLLHWDAEKYRQNIK